MYILNYFDISYPFSGKIAFFSKDNCNSNFHLCSSTIWNVISSSTGSVPFPWVWGTFDSLANGMQWKWCHGRWQVIPLIPWPLEHLHWEFWGCHVCKEVKPHGEDTYRCFGLQSYSASHLSAGARSESDMGCQPLSHPHLHSLCGAESTHPFSVLSKFLTCRISEHIKLVMVLNWYMLGQLIMP